MDRRPLAQAASGSPNLPGPISMLTKIADALQDSPVAKTADVVVATIENKPGQAGSLAVYNHLAQLYGAISPEAAKKGLDLYAEHTEDARTNPGKHPNIDRLIGLAERGETLRVKQVFAV